LEPFDEQQNIGKQYYSVVEETIEEVISDHDEELD